MKSNQSNFIYMPGNKFLFRSLLFLICLLFVITGTSARELPAKTFVVATSGKDGNPGTQELPFATLEAARDAARADQSGACKIIIMPGEYYLTRPFELDPSDNGLTIEADTGGTVILYGGTLVTGWISDGDKFWVANLPGVKEGNWDFRSLIVNGRMPERARMPESGTFLHQQNWDIRVLPAVAGYWERQPFPEELKVMAYNSKDIPETLDVKNAEVRIYHMWDESLVGIARNDINRHELIFSTPAIYPPGAFGKKDYVIFNTREGMTKPGQWYLDRTAGRLVYWPLKGEDMTTAKIIAPKIDQIIRISGEPNRQAENITIRGLKLQATNIPLKPAGFGGAFLDGALSLKNTRMCRLEKLEISNVGGMGILADQMYGGQIIDCEIHNTGACGVKVNGFDTFISRNHIHHVGIYFPSSAAFYSQSSGKGTHIYRNEINDAPYSGMIIGKSGLLVEENLIYRVMREVHDGAAIYASGSNNCILRGNIVRDISESGQGFGVSAYYLDEGATDCIVEKNISMNVARPIHNHIARNTIIRDNVFISDEDMTLSFQSSANFTFEGNTLITNGKINIIQPNAIIIWKENKIFSNSRGMNGLPQAFTIDSVMPSTPIPGRKTYPIEVVHTVKAPALDGNLASDEWPGDFQRIDREPSRLPASGAPVLVKFSYDDQFLYIGAIVTMFEPEKISKGSAWGKDDGVEISLGGFTGKGMPTTFVIRAYVDGTIQSITDAGATAMAAGQLGKEVRFISKMKEKRGNGGGWIGEWAIPLRAIGLKPKPGLKVAFNMCAYINEYGKWHCWEGTQGESWQVGQAGMLQLK
jgi:hypothetical protein